jgi:hypothetical protein
MPPVVKPVLKGAAPNTTTRRAASSENTPLLLKDDEATAQLRDRTTTSYTTIALVSALLSAVSFAAYATPPAELFASASSAPPGPPGMMPPPLTARERMMSPPPAPPSPHGVDGFYTHYIKDNPIFTKADIDFALAIFMQILWHIYGIGASRAPAVALRRGGLGGGGGGGTKPGFGFRSHACRPKTLTPSGCACHPLVVRATLWLCLTVPYRTVPCSQSCRWRSCATWRAH